MDSSVVIPITFWNPSEPVFRISTVCISPNFKKLITGSYNGQLCLWDFDLRQGKITPRNILIGHNESVTCMTTTNEYVISACEGKMLCRWNLDDGYCSKMNTSLFIHRKMHLFLNSDAKEEFLFTCGDYTEIFVIHSFTLQIISIIQSRNTSVWISGFHVITSKENHIVSGITADGCAKVWVLNDLMNDAQSEADSYILSTSDVVDFRYNLNLTQVIVVSISSWMLYDSKFTNCLCKVEAFNNDTLLGGNFCDADVVVWTKSGKAFLYNVSNGVQELISIFLDDFTKISLFMPALSLLQNEKEKYLIKGDSEGRISIWEVKSHQKEIYPMFSIALSESWVSNENGFFNSFIPYSSVTCCIFVLEIDRFFVGCFNGSIVSIPATESIMSFYFYSALKKPLTDIFVAHKGKINCLLYPHEKYSYFNESHLVSGGSDFCVCLWDVFKSELLFKFCEQSGEILKLIVPPEDCSMPVKISVCSVSSDHSVAILNLSDKRCLILTSRHEFPVVMVHWKPLHDFIIIECFDGTVYVWQMQTGHLDRVLNGVMAQEVIYACTEPEPNILSWNFYMHEQIMKENSMKHKVFEVQESTESSPFHLNKFLINETSESHMFVCNLESTFAQFSCNFDSESFNYSTSSDAYVLTKALTKDLPGKFLISFDKMKQETETVQHKFQCQKNNNIKTLIRNEVTSETKIQCPSLDEKILKLIQLFLSSIHFWGLNQCLDEFLSSKLGVMKPEKTLCLGILSYPGVYSLYLPSPQNLWQKSSSLLASICVTTIAFSKILIFCDTSDQVTGSIKTWMRKLISLYELTYLNPDQKLAIPKPRLEILAKAWQSKCSSLRKIVRKILYSYLQGLDPKENADLLGFWYKYLPHFKILDKTLPNKVDFENVDLKTVAIILFGAVGSDFKFKCSDSSCQETYIYQTCAAFVYLLLLPEGRKSPFSTLQIIAVDFIGRGYIVWEQFLKMEKVLPVLFKMCIGFSDKAFELGAPLNECSFAYNALKAIAIARTAAFINCLKNEIIQVRSRQNLNLLTNNFKAEILSIMTFLLEETPYIMLLHLNDVIMLIVHCIDLSHLRQENLSNLVPVIQRFRQVHHSVTTQKIAVGLATGVIVLHDLRSGKLNEVSAHKDSVSALKFSEDGKSLVSYSCYENRLSFWQVLTGLFGLGHVHVKCTKSCKTYEINDEKIRNHLEIASLTWTDKKSVKLSFCDGTEDTFHS